MATQEHLDPAPSLESLFRRWRDEEDSGALAETLARTEAELFAIARRQARDDSAAWDLVQETWLTVLREARRWDANQRLMPWLVGILQIEARRARRDATRTPDPVRLDAPVQHAPEAEAPAAEVRFVVKRAVDQLPDLYREVLSMHLLEDLSHTEIAARTGREPGTVRVQVFRGLAQLRKLVPASLALGAALAVLAPNSAAARLAPVLDGAVRGGSGAGVGTTTAATAAKTGAGVATGSGVAWLLGAAAAALVAAGAWVGLTHDASDGELARTVAPLDAPADAGDRRVEADLYSAPTALARAAVASVATTVATPPVVVRGVHLVGRVDGLAALQPGAPTVRVRADGFPPLAVPIEAGPRFDVDLSGWYAPGVSAPREFVVEYDHPNALPEKRPFLLEAGALAAARTAAGPDSDARHEFEVDFALRAPAARVHGFTVWADDVDADARSGCVAALFQTDATGGMSAEPIEGVDVRPDGTFSLRTLHFGSHVLLVAAHMGDVRPATLFLDLAAGEDRDVGRVELGIGPAISGTVQLDPGASTAILEPIVRWRSGAGELHSVHGTAVNWNGARFEQSGGTALVRRDGGFRIAGLPGEAVELESAWQSRAPSGSKLDVAREWSRAIRVVAPATGVVLDAPGSITVLTVRASGSAIDRAVVNFEPETGEGAFARTDASGHARLVGAGAGRLRVRMAGYETFERAFTGALGPAIDVDLVPAHDVGTIVLAANGVEWKDAQCVLVLASTVDDAELAALRRGEMPPQVEIQRATVDADGRLAAPVRAERWWIQVRGRRDAVDGALAHARPFVAEVEVLPGATSRVDVELALAGRIRFAPVAARAGAENVALELVAADGKSVPLDVTSLVLRGDARQGRVTTQDALPFGANGTSALVEPGAYVLTARAGAAVWSRAVLVEAGRTAVVDLDAP